MSHPNYNVIGQGVEGCFREEWRRRPIQVIGYFAVGVFLIVGFVLLIVDTTTKGTMAYQEGLYQSGIGLIGAGITLAIIIVFFRCRETRAEQNTTIVVV